MKRLLITGTRYGWEEPVLREILIRTYYEMAGQDVTTDEPVLLVHGDAPGVDTQAAQIWEGWGLPTEAHPADWGTYGEAAGPIRNQEMVDLGADRCLAFVAPSSRGTRHCLRVAREAGIPTDAFYI